MSYEHHKKPLATRGVFLQRILRNFLWCIAIVVVSLAIGTTGYHFTAKLGWMDSFYNSSMILTGMGPVDHIGSNSGKLFASFYALFSGIAFLTTIAVFSAPIIHRFMHRFHIQDE